VGGSQQPKVLSFTAAGQGVPAQTSFFGVATHVQQQALHAIVCNFGAAMSVVYSAGKTEHNQQQIKCCQRHTELQPAALGKTHTLGLSVLKLQ
jgi:hypothetical protein